MRRTRAQWFAASLLLALILIEDVVLISKIAQHAQITNHNPPFKFDHAA